MSQGPSNRDTRQDCQGTERLLIPIPAAAICIGFGFQPGRQDEVDSLSMDDDGGFKPRTPQEVMELHEEILQKQLQCILTKNVT